MIVIPMAGTLLLAAVILSPWILVPTLRKLRRGDPELRQTLRRLDAERRRRIRAHLRGGEAIADPGDARLALRWSTHTDELARLTRRLQLGNLPFLAAVTLVAIHYEIVLVFYIEGAGLLVWVASTVFTWRAAHRRQRSVAATRELHGI